jgi:glycine dehydrogenase subunit 2
MNAPNVSGWKPGTPEAPSGPAGIETVTGNRGLMLEEPLIFEIGGANTCGVDFTSPLSPAGGGQARRSSPLGADRTPRPFRTRDRAPLHPTQPAELRDRLRHLPARQLHDEA